MDYEVEQKFRVSDFEQVESALARFGAAIGPSEEQLDCYYDPPGRQLSVTGEAFRLRRTGTQNAITYKGPKIDSTTKTRRELELPLPEGVEYFSRMSCLLEAVGFRRVGEVHKQRRKAYVGMARAGDQVEVSLDEVAGVGTYVELELRTPAEGVAAAREQLSELATRLGLAENERRSYLELRLLTSVPENIENA